MERGRDKKLYPLRDTVTVAKLEKIRLTFPSSDLELLVVSR